MTELDTDGNLVMRPVLQPGLPSLYRYRSLLLSAVVWTEPRLEMKPIRTEKRGTMYVQTMPKKRKMVKFTLNVLAVSDAQDIKEEDIVDKSYSAVFLTPSE